MKRPGLRWHHYLGIIVLGMMFIGLPIAILIVFSEKIKQAQAYGYAGVFLAGLLCGISVIPAPTQLLIFTFGRILNPWQVGLIAGFGAAVGGITVYLTGAGVQSIWSRIHKRELALQHQLGIDTEQSDGKLPKLLQFGKVVYDKLEDWISGRKGAWALFFTSALVISPFYPAGLAAGSLRMGLWKFFLISWAGKTVRYLSVALAGYYGIEIILRILRLK